MSIKIIKDDLWNVYTNGYYVVVPTNSYVNSNGKAAMGRGVSLQATLFFKNLENVVGKSLTEKGRTVLVFPRQRLVIFPTKDNWKHPATLEIIEESCKALLAIMKKDEKLRVVMPKVGCGNGKLNFEQVYPLIEKYFGEFDTDRFLIADNGQGDSRYYRGKNEKNIVGEPEEEDTPLIIEPDTGLKLTYKDLLNGKQ